MEIVFLESESVGTDISHDRLRELGHLTEYPVADIEDTPNRIRNADIILCNKTPLGEAALKDAAHVKMIAEMATGYDNVDVKYCRARGIAVANVPAYSTTAVAQHTFALALSLLGKIPYYNHYVQSGTYAAQSSFSCFADPITELDGKTWGILGRGAIGTRVARIAAAFGCRVLFAPVSGRTPEKPDETDLDTLLGEADILSLHCPLSERTHHLINAETLGKMKSTAILINVARGKVVDQNALADALERGIIAGAGLDVFEEEPMTKENPLLAIQDPGRLILTPHMAWASVEARERDVAITADNIKAFLKGERLNRVDL